MELIELCDVSAIRCPGLTAIQQGSEYDGLVSCYLSRESNVVIVP
jgi:hypothetical protein